MLRVRFTQIEIEEIARVAIRSDTPLSTWIREQVVAAARAAPLIEEPKKPAVTRKGKTYLPWLQDTKT